MKCRLCAAPDLADGPDAPPVSFDDSLANREAEARADRAYVGLPESIEEGGRSSAGMPWPESVTEIRTAPSVFVTRTTTLPPSSENFSAFPTRLGAHAGADRDPRASAPRRPVRPPTSRCAWRGPGLTKLDGVVNQRSRVDTLVANAERPRLHPSHVEQVDHQALHAADGSRDDVDLPLTLVLLRGDREHRCGTENGLQRVAEVVRKDRQDLIAKLRRALRVRARIALAIQEGFAFLLDGFLGRQVDDNSTPSRSFSRVAAIAPTAVCRPP